MDSIHATLNQFLIDIPIYFDQYQTFFPLLIPLGTIGIWRWGVWGIKRTVAFLYRPKKTSFDSRVSLITPVYNENPDTFTRALASWKKNGLDEIIAVIDYSDTTCINIFKKFAKVNPTAKLIVTKIPGKRPALADGIEQAKHPIVALVDSDTIWEDEVLKNALPPFADKKLAAVATRQSVENPKTLAQKLFSIRLEQRYWDDIPFLTVTGNVLSCVSGRTGFYRREVLLPLLDALVNETFLGKKVISGEDKRLTYLVEAQGWKVTYQSNAHVFTPGEKNLSTFINQQIRWTRNSWRADLSALKQGWTLKHPIFTLYLIDRAIQPFTLLISPVYFAISLALQLWLPVIGILVWWHITRGVKMIPHLKRKPLDIVILPLFIVYNFLTAYIRIYALFSLNTQGWITRWDSVRLPRMRWLQSSMAHLLTIAVVGITLLNVYGNKERGYLLPLAHERKMLALALSPSETLAQERTPAILGTSSVDPNALLAQKYEYQTGDWLGHIAQKYGIEVYDLLIANVAHITNWNRIPQGLVMTIPPKGETLISNYKFNYQRIYPDYLNIGYDQPTDTIVVTGRGTEVTLQTILDRMGKDYLEEVSPKQWYLKTSIYLRSGVTLKLDKSEVEWLKMASSPKKFTYLHAFNSNILINGVKITSWNEETNTYDTDIQDGRSYIMVKDGSRMDLTGAEIAYLGYARPETLPYSPYGISWKMSNTKLHTAILTGEVLNSRFHDNYFGAYTFGATGMVWRGNEFYANVRYGLDPHDDSNGFLVENNKFYRNGTHGLIFSKRCINNTIRNNISYENGIHGIMLHEQSNNNVIENNLVHDNKSAGIALDNSHNNTIRSNTIIKNRIGMRANKKSSGNLIVSNRINDNTGYGIYLYGEANDNKVQQNILANNMNGVYIKSSNNEISGNSIVDNKVGVYFLGTAGSNKMAGNIISHNKVYGIYTKLSENVQNFLSQNNTLLTNKKDATIYIPKNGK